MGHKMNTHASDRNFSDSRTFTVYLMPPLSFSGSHRSIR